MRIGERLGKADQLIDIFQPDGPVGEVGLGVILVEGFVDEVQDIGGIVFNLRILELRESRGKVRPIGGGFLGDRFGAGLQRGGDGESGIRFESSELFVEAEPEFIRAFATDAGQEADQAQLH